MLAWNLRLNADRTSTPRTVSNKYRIVQQWFYTIHVRMSTWFQHIFHTQKELTKIIIFCQWHFYSFILSAAIKVQNIENTEKKICLQLYDTFAVVRIAFCTTRITVALDLRNTAYASTFTKITEIHSDLCVYWETSSVVHHNLQKIYSRLDKCDWPTR